VIDGDRLLVSYRGSVVADVSPDTLVLGGGAPVYIRETRRPLYLDLTMAFQPASIPVPADLGSVLRLLIASPNIASKRWVYEQYDSMVRTNNVVLAQSDAAVVHIKKTDTALALKTDCNGRYVYLNPRRGAMIAVARAPGTSSAPGGLRLPSPTASTSEIPISRRSTGNSRKRLPAWVRRAGCSTPR